MYPCHLKYSPIIVLADRQGIRGMTARAPVNTRDTATASHHCTVETNCRGNGMRGFSVVKNKLLTIALVRRRYCFGSPARGRISSDVLWCSDKTSFYSLPLYRAFIRIIPCCSIVEPNWWTVTFVFFVVWLMEYRELRNNEKTRWIFIVKIQLFIQFFFPVLLKPKIPNAISWTLFHQLWLFFSELFVFTIASRDRVLQLAVLVRN